MIINGKDFEFNYQDTVHIKRLRVAGDKVQEDFGKSKKIRKSGGMDASIAAIEHDIQSVRNFFDEVIGAGTAEKAFEKSTDLRIYVNSFSQFFEDISTQMISDGEETTRKMNRVSEKIARFSPQGQPTHSAAK